MSSRPHRPSAAVLLAGLAWATLCLPASAQWTQRGQDAAVSYANTTEKQLTPANVGQLRPVWRTHARSKWGLVNSEATQSDGLVVDCLYPAAARARWAASGVVAWQIPLDAQSCATPALGDGKVYMPLSAVGNVANVGGLAALDLATGAELWRSTWPAADGRTTAPALVGDTLYIADRTATLRAIDAATGSVKWQSQTASDALNNGVAVADGRAFVTTLRGWNGVTPPGTYAFDAGTGQPLWTQLVQNCNYIEAPAMVLGDRVIIRPCGAAPMTARRASDGELLWKKTDLPDHPSQAFVGHGDTIYSPHYSLLVAIDANTGQDRWRIHEQQDFDGFATNLAWANGMLFMLIDKALDYQLELRVLDATTGQSLVKRRQKYPQYARIFGNSLTVADGRVQVGYYADDGIETGKSHWIAYGLD